MENQAENRIAGDESHGGLGEHGQPALHGEVVGDRGDDFLHDLGESLLDQRGEHVLLVAEVLVDRGTPDPYGGGDVTQGEHLVSDFSQQLACGIDQLMPGQFLVLLDVGGAYPRHGAPGYGPVVSEVAVAVSPGRARRPSGHPRQTRSGI